MSDSQRAEVTPSSETQVQLVGTKVFNLLLLENLRPAFSPYPTDCPYVSEDEVTLVYTQKLCNISLAYLRWFSSQTGHAYCLPSCVHWNSAESLYGTKMALCLNVTHQKTKAISYVLRLPYS